MLSQVTYRLILGLISGIMATEAGARPGVSFSGGSFSGIVAGEGFRRGSNVPIEVVPDSQTIFFSGQSGGGGTSGGLVDAAVQVASVHLDVNGLIEHHGSDYATLEMRVAGAATFHRPDSYYGSTSSTVQVGTPIELQISDNQGGGVFFTITTPGAFSGLVTGLIRTTTGQFFPPATYLPSGRYRIMDSGVFNVGVTDQTGGRSVNEVMYATFSTFDCEGGPPFAVQQPVGTTGCMSGSVQLTFTAGQNGFDPMVYRWRRNGVPLINGGSGSGSVYSGATSRTLVISNFQSADAGASYDCVATNPCGSTTSTSVTLAVASGPVFTSHPQPQTVCVQDAVSLSIEVNGTQPFNLQWRRGGIALSDGPTPWGSTISGAASSTLRITGFHPMDAGVPYDCVASNICGTLDSNDAVLNAADRVMVTVQPVEQRVCVNGTALFAVGVSGTQPVGYQWRRGEVALHDGPTGSGSVIEGARSSRMRITHAGPADGGTSPEERYSVVVTNTCGSDISRTISLAVCVADFSCDGIVNSQDFFNFITAFFIGGPPADINDDTVVNTQDFFEFVQSFFAGCA